MTDLSHSCHFRGCGTGLTDWITLPYKAARDGGGAHGILKGLLWGIANVFVKLSAGWSLTQMPTLVPTICKELTGVLGCFTIFFHPIFGIY